MKNALVAARVGLIFAGLYYGSGVILSWSSVATGTDVQPIEAAFWCACVHAAWRSFLRAEGGK